MIIKRAKRFPANPKHPTWGNDDDYDEYDDDYDDKDTIDSVSGDDGYKNDDYEYEAAHPRKDEILDHIEGRDPGGVNVIVMEH